jgi:formylmethanofuran dehydrogenase subunit B
MDLDERHNRIQPPNTVEERSAPPQLLMADRVCLGCGCLCDDLVIEYEPGSVPKMLPACNQGQIWLEQCWSRSVKARTLARVQGVPCTSREAVKQAAGILKSARSVLISGLSSLPIEAQQSAVNIGVRLNAVIDPDLGPDVPAWLDVERRLGWMSATWGEIRARSDLFVLWGTMPEDRIPRWRERLALGDSGRPSFQVVLDRQLPSAGTDAIHIAPQRELHALESLRVALLSEQDCDPAFAMLDPILHAIRNARSVAWILGPSQTKTRIQRTLTLESIARLSRSQNATKRFRVISAPEPQHDPNSAGAVAVLTWLCGGASALDARAGSAVFDPLACDPRALILRGEVDAVLEAGPISVLLDDQLRNASIKIARIAIGAGATSHDSLARDVEMEAAIPGLEAGGTYLRADGIPLFCEATLPPPPCPSTKEWLDRLRLELTEDPAT